MEKRRVGIIGYGHLGRYLVQTIVHDEMIRESLELAFVYNRNRDKIGDDVADELKLTRLDDFIHRQAHLIVEVAHPEISKHATQFLAHADYMAGSPTAFADRELEIAVYRAASESRYGLYVPQGAMWYLDRLQYLTARGQLQELSITMKKHPDSIKYCGPLTTSLAQITRETLIYQGSVRELCRYAPNNVNTMAVAAMAVPHLGFDGVEAKLVVDPNLQAHVIEVDIIGPGEGNRYREGAYRYNPAVPGAVTGSATYRSFLDSILRACGQGSGVHFC